ncbi:MAG TPA: (4Fe-4S)-binding protein, partial [Firmicutes bacterium]|nr:(4Fe-4S)-binding protein [Bacillota bacterium]
MKQVAVVSGKGGTGKTTVAASLAVLWKQRKILADCDVDASNLPLVLRARVEREEPFIAGKVAEIDPALCRNSGKCFEACRFEAVERTDGSYTINSLACEGCSVCALVCPQGAITMHEVESGRLFESSTAYGPMVHAALEPGRENSGKLVTSVRDTALERAKESDAEIILIDGSPGIGCPVIASLSGASLALVVVEPTLTGLQGMERVIAVARHFGVPCVVCINKADLSPPLSARIEQQCGTPAPGVDSHTTPVIGKIPFDRAVVEANSRLIPVVESAPSRVTRALEALAAAVLSRLYEGKGAE